MITHAAVIIGIAAAPALVAATAPLRAWTVTGPIEAALQARGTVGVGAWAVSANRAAIRHAVKAPLPHETALLPVTLKVASFEVAAILDLDQAVAVRAVRRGGCRDVALGKQGSA